MILKDLILNLALLASISVFSGFIGQRQGRSTINGKIMQGLLFGLAAIAGMTTPFVLSEGIIFDGRSVIVSLAAFYFGPVTGIIAASLAVFFRFWLGGAGVFMGVSVIISSLLIGLAFGFWRRKNSIKRVSLINLFILGLAVHVAMLVLIVALPATFRMETFNIIALTVLGGYPLVTVITGKILLDQELTETLITELSEKEGHYRTTLYCIADAVITTDSKGLINHFNPQAEALSGWPENLVLNKPIVGVLNIFDEKSRQQIDLSKNDTENTFSTIQTENVVLLRSDGTEIPIMFSMAPICSVGGDKLGYVLVFRDVTDERKRKEIVERSEESYKGLFNSITDAIYVQDRQGRFLDVNTGATTLYGYPKEHFLGHTPALLSAPGRNDLESIEKHIEKAFEGIPQRFKFWGVTSKGHVFPKEVNLFKTTYFGHEAIIAIGHDISEREQSNQLIYESEERYRSLFNASPVGIILEDENGIIIDANPAVCQQYGYSLNELVGQNIVILAPEQDRELVKNNIKIILKQNYREGRVKSCTKDGKKLIMQLAETTMILPDGRRGILSISKDITEQVNAETRLRESEARNAAIIAALPDLLFRISSDGTYLDFYAENNQLLLLDADKFLGKKVSDIHTEELAKLTLDKILLTLRNEVLQQYEYTLELNGRTKWFDARMTKSGPDEVLVIVRDITVRKLSDLDLAHKTAFIETLLDSVPNPLFYMDKKGVYLGVNKAFLDFYKLDRQSIIGKRIFDLDSPEDAERNYKSDQLILEGWEQQQLFERRIKLPNGQEHDVIITKSPFPDSRGEVGGLIGIILDITARKKMELELRDAKDRAEESDRLKTAFLNNISHEIRTPMNAIVGFSSLLGDAFEENQKNHFVNIINTNAEQLLRIIDDVLAVSRLDSEKMVVEKENISLEILLFMVYNTCLPEVRKMNLLLKEPEIDTQLPPSVLTDGAKIIQVMTGLIDNAIKYTNQGHITFGCKLLNNRLHFYVSDTGVGIREEEQPLVFNRFFRSESAQRNAIRGNGLGLSIAKGLIELLEGNIGLLSKEGKGSTFYFEIPLVVSNMEQKKTLKLDMTEHNMTEHLVVLVAEDEDDNFYYLETLLQDKVKTIIRATNGAEAMQIVDNQNIDLILMDIKMPVVDGISATKAILSKHPEMPVIVQSAYAQPDEIKKAIEAGSKACVVKPIDKDRLMDHIRDLVQK